MYSRTVFLGLLFLLPLILHFGVIRADQASCLDSCNMETQSSPCCGCCNNASQTCHQIPELATCCQKTESFCGCLSYRAYCSGSVFAGESSTDSPFGTCYNQHNPATSQCCYEPSPNIWIVCPSDSTCCSSNSYMTCCSAGTVCNTTIADSYPQCVPSSAALSDTSASNNNALSSASVVVTSTAVLVSEDSSSTAESSSAVVSSSTPVSTAVVVSSTTPVSSSVPVTSSVAVESSATVETVSSSISLASTQTVLSTETAVVSDTVVSTATDTVSLDTNSPQGGSSESTSNNNNTGDASSLIVGFKVIASLMALLLAA